MAGRAPTFRIRKLSLAASRQHSVVFLATEAQIARSQSALRRVLRHGPTQLGRCLYSLGTRLSDERLARRARYYGRSSHQIAGAGRLSLHRMRRLVAAQCAGQIAFDFPLRIAAILLAEL